MNTVYILLGGNLGDRVDNLKKAICRITDGFGSLVSKSLLYETAAWGVEDQPDFLNQVIQINTNLSSFDLLKHLQQIEIELGRKRYQKWHERTIDIDILYFNDEVNNTDVLKTPHPFMHERRFTLVPLNEIAAEFNHPILKKSTTQLLDECLDRLPVYEFSIKEV